MKSFAITAITLALAGLGSAGVVNQARQDPAPAASTTLRLCMNQDFQGECVTQTVPDNACWNFSPHLSDKVSSLNTHGDRCTFFVNSGCSGNKWDAQGSHPTIPSNFNDKLSSVRCHHG